MHIAYKIWRNTIYSAHVVDASIERRRNTSYAIHFYKLYNVSEKWNYGVARRVESYETPSFYFIFKWILLTKVNQPMRCGAFGFYLLIFVKFVQQMVPTELADLWLSRWNLFYRLLFFFFHIYKLFKLHHNGNGIFMNIHSIRCTFIYLFCATLPIASVLLSASLALVLWYSPRNDVRVHWKVSVGPSRWVDALKIKLFHFE